MDHHKAVATAGGCQLLLTISPNMEELHGKINIPIQQHGVLAMIRVSTLSQSGFNLIHRIIKQQLMIPQ